MHYYLCENDEQMDNDNKQEAFFNLSCCHGYNFNTPISPYPADADVFPIVFFGETTTGFSPRSNERNLKKLREAL